MHGWKRWKTRAGVLLAAAPLALAGGCGGDDPAKPLRMAAQTEEGAAPDGPPRIESVSLDPAEPRAGETVHARVRAAAAHGARPELEYAWQVGDHRLAERGASIRLPAVAKGESVELTVFARHGELESEPESVSATVANSPPRIRGLRLMSHQNEDGEEEFVADLSADDPDGDFVDIRYIWLVNDQVHAVEEERFPTSLLKAGDRLRLRVVADDGEDESAPAETGVVGISNAAPDIVSTPAPVDGSETYVYQLEAEDPDGDGDMRWELVEGPRGMHVDATSGRLSWTPDIEQAGTHRVEVAVSDGQGGRTTQVFELAILVGYDYSAAPAAMP